MVYIADDGTLDLLGPSRAYGAELKTSVEISRHLSFTGGITQVANAFYIATSPREYVDRAPRFTANAALTIAAWKGWTASFRLRAINGYRLNREPGESPLRAAGNTVTDFSLVRRLRRNLDCNFAIDNIADRTYLETQNYVESRPYPNAPAAFGIHGTPGYPRTITAGLTFRFRGK
jgi:outer membrane receptor for monomeric catechols